MTEQMWIYYFMISMRHNIETLGKEKCLEVIESIPNPKARLKYRALYYRCLNDKFD